MTKSEIITAFMVAEKEDPTKKISDPEDVIPLIAKYAKKNVEYYVSISLDGNHKIKRVREVTKGILDRTIVHPREVFAPILKERASAVILAHNHPSGSLNPSPEDKELAKRMIDAGEILGIPVLDNVIISKNGFFSFLSAGLQF